MEPSYSYHFKFYAPKPTSQSILNGLRKWNATLYKTLTEPWIDESLIMLDSKH
jgi:hypothetical protein